MTETKKDTRLRCLDAAIDLIRTNGYDGLSMREVARVAGVSATAPYRHFESRDDLLSAVATQSFLLLTERLKSCCDGGLHRLTMEQFQSMGLAYIGFAQQYPERYKLMFGTDLPSIEQHPERSEAAAGAFQVLHDSVEIMQRLGHLTGGDSEKIAIHIWALTHGWASLFIDGRFQEHTDGKPWQDEWLEHWQIAVAGLSPKNA